MHPRAKQKTNLVFLVLARVGVAWDDGGDPAGGCDLAGVDHDQQLHQVVVNLSTSRLHDVHVLPPDGLPYFDAEKSIATLTPLRLDLGRWSPDRPRKSEDRPFRVY